MSPTRLPLYPHVNCVKNPSQSSNDSTVEQTSSPMLSLGVAASALRLPLREIRDFPSKIEYHGRILGRKRLPQVGHFSER
jgi:hypothetical protein